MCMCACVGAYIFLCQSFLVCCSSVFTWTCSFDFSFAVLTNDSLWLPRRKRCPADACLSLINTRTFFPSRPGKQKAPRVDYQMIDSRCCAPALFYLSFIYSYLSCFLWKEIWSTLCIGSVNEGYKYFSCSLWCVCAWYMRKEFQFAVVKLWYFLSLHRMLVSDILRLEIRVLACTDDGCK